MNSSIGILSIGGMHWMGGVYYVKSFIQQILLLNIQDRPNIYLFVSEDMSHHYEDIIEDSKFKKIILKDDYIDAIINFSSNLVFKRKLNLMLLRKDKLKKYISKYNIKYIYPVLHPLYKNVGQAECVYWIPDFQHLHLPYLFNKNEIKRRNNEYRKISKLNNKLILSSKDALNDYKSIFPNFNNDVKVVHFASLLHENIFMQNAEAILKKYKLPSRYFFVPNQFWKHKNHLLIFQAVDLLVNKLGIDVNIVCSGSFKDYRNNEYIDSLMDYIKSKKIDQKIKILGFIPRADQLQIMRFSDAIIQPSLFEGWSTVVEDAKSIGKTLILSDLEVHKEQNPDKVLFFDKFSEIDLAEKMKLVIKEVKEKENFYDCSEALIICKKRAVQYATTFVDFLEVR